MQLLLTVFWLCAATLVLLNPEGVQATSLASIPAARPKPIVLTTAKPPASASKPRTSKPDNSPDLPDVPSSGGDGGGGTGSTTTSPSGYLFLPCTDLEVALVMGPNDMDVQQCMMFSGYNFASGYIPTFAQKTLLCDTGCWNLIYRLENTPIPYCSVNLGGRAVNYIDALYTVFSECSAPQQPVATASAATSTPAPTAPSSGAPAWRMSLMSLAVLVVAGVLVV